MSIEAPIATRHLRAIWSDGTTHDVRISIGRPYPDGSSYRCHLEVSGLQPAYTPPDLVGHDEIQAIMQSLEFIRFLLEWHLSHGGSLFYPDSGGPYLPDDLPKTSSDEIDLESQPDRTASLI